MNDETIRDESPTAIDSDRTPTDQSSLPPEIPEPPQPWWQRTLLKYGSERLGLPIRMRDSLVLIGLVVIADIGLYSEPGGTGNGFVLVTATAGLLALRWREARAAIYPVLTILAIALMGMWREWWLLPIIGWGALIVTAIKLHHPEWHILETLWAGFSSVARSPARLLGHIVAIYLRHVDIKSESNNPSPRAIPLRAILIPIATLIMFVLIFRAANPVIARITDGLSEQLAAWCESLTHLISYGRLLFWGLWMLLFAALVRPVSKSPLADLLGMLSARSRPTRNATPNESLASSRAGACNTGVASTPNDGNYITAWATLICVNLLFAAYLVMDSVYLYFKGTLPEGITWTDYTHAGCGWLTLGLAVSTAIIGIIFAGDLNIHPRAQRLRLIADIWAVQNLILSMGTIRRLLMYIDFSGLTHLRITGIYGAILVAVGLIIMVAKIHRQHGFVWILHNYTLAFSLALVFLALTPNEWICSTYNVAKVLEGKPRALQPIVLKKLSPEALPPLVRLLDYERPDGNKQKETIVRQGIAALLRAHLAKLDAKSDVSWPQRQGCAVWARRELARVRDRLSDITPPAQQETAKRRLLNNINL